MFLTVYLSNNEQHFTEVPVTPETVCRDVVDLCKEPGESDCHLAEVWCGSGMAPGQPPAAVAVFYYSGFADVAECDTRVCPQRNRGIACPSGDSVLHPAFL